MGTGVAISEAKIKVVSYSRDLRLRHQTKTASISSAAATPPMVPAAMPAIRFGSLPLCAVWSVVVVPSLPNLPSSLAIDIDSTAAAVSIAVVSIADVPISAVTADTFEGDGSVWLLSVTPLCGLPFRTDGVATVVIAPRLSFRAVTLAAAAVRVDAALGRLP